MLTVRYLLAFLFTFPSDANVTCSDNCKCKVSGAIADCSYLGLTNISEVTNCLPNNIKTLNMSYNSLRQIPPRTFVKFLILDTLNLDHNNIGSLYGDTFEGLERLQTLTLNRNDLRLTSSFAEDVFNPLRNIRRLDLQGNCDTSVEQCSYPIKALSSAKSLQTLYIDGFPSFGPDFPRLNNLQSLYFGFIDGYCKFPILTETTFSSFTNSSLSHLQMDGCNVIDLEPNVFRGLKNLTTLIITYNRYLCGDSIENATRGLNKTNIKTLRFNKWCIHRPMDIRLEAGMLKGLTNTSLKTLDLTHNHIIYIDGGCIKNLPLSIMYLSLKENKINRGEFIEDLKILDNLETLDISNQAVHKNVVTFFISRFQSLKRNNSSTIVDEDELFHLPKKLKTLYMQNIRLGFPIPQIRFAPNALEYFDVSDCGFGEFLGPWYCLKLLQYLDLSSNRFDYFRPMALVGMTDLRTLRLHNNYLGAPLAADQNGDTFSSQINLESLDLGNNGIKILPQHAFKNLGNLTHISLAENSMQNVSFSLKPMSKLQYLNLSLNQVQYISHENTVHLDEIARNTDVHVNLLGNVLSCLCDNQQFVNWLSITKVNIVEREKLKCLYPNQTLVSLRNIKLIASQLKYECSAWFAVTSCAVGFLALLLLLSLIAVLHNKRWQLMYLWYIGRLNIDPFHHPADEGQQLLEINAYISYEQHYDVTNDVTLHEVIAETIYPFLQGRGYVVKIREEFEATDKLYQVIPEAVRKTWKMIVFLTSSYCKDYWNTFEFNLAAYQGIYTKKSIIIPILVGNILETDLLTPEIKSFVMAKIKSKDVLQFPTLSDDQSVMDDFLDQLDQLLK